MDAASFIAKRIKFRGRIAIFSVAISFLVMIIAVAVSSGFRHEIRDGVSSISGDIQLASASTDWTGETSPVPMRPSWLGEVEKIRGVAAVDPVIYRAGILKIGDNIQGVLFKGVADTLLSGLRVSVPSTLAARMELSAGDDITAYFVGEKVKVRKFSVASLYESILGADENLIIYASLPDLQRLNGWGEEDVSAIELTLDRAHKDMAAMESITAEAGSIALLLSAEDEPAVVATSAVSRYPQLFDWLNLIDFNVLFILALMTIVAGFNMISGLLILLFENIPSIGILKSLGMKDRSIAKIFLSASSSLVLKGMAIGNLVAFAFCFIQSFTKVLKLDPDNYFVSFVPVHLDIPLILAADAAAYIVIMLLLLVPSLFISGIDPAKTVRMG